MKISQMKRNDYFWAYVMIAPTSLGLLIFYFWPLLQSIYFSMTKWGSFGKYKWVGMENFTRVIEDKELWLAFKNTLVYTAISVPITITLSIIVAVLLNQKIRGIGVYRTLFYLPVVTMAAAIAMVWRWIFNADFGVLNYILSLFSIGRIQWLTNPDLALYCVIAVAIWCAIGSNMILFLSGLQGISSNYYEAASIDGASTLSKFFHITLPMLTPTIFFVLVNSLIGAFQVFDLIFMMLPQSAALESSQTVVYLFYKQAFMFGDKGYASAIAMILFVLILLITIVQFRLQKKWVHYE